MKARARLGLVVAVIALTVVLVTSNALGRTGGEETTTERQPQKVVDRPKRHEDRRRQEELLQMQIQHSLDALIKSGKPKIKFTFVNFY